MDKGIYTALSGGIARGHEVEIVANNLANVNTPGFKRDNGTFNEYLTELRRTDSVEGVKREIQVAAFESRPPGDKSFVEMDSVYTDFRQGALDRTGRSLDLGLEGKGFFEVFTPQGVRFTRQGNLNIDNEGKLVNINGYPVLARDPKRYEKVYPYEPPPPETRQIYLSSGTFSITPDGDIYQNGLPAANLSIVEFHENQWLEKIGHSFFRNTHENNLRREPPETRVHQGFLEISNVNPVQEMTRLIEATRAYESQIQTIKTFQEIDSKSVSDIARLR